VLILEGPLLPAPGTIKRLRFLIQSDVPKLILLVPGTRIELVRRLNSEGFKNPLSILTIPFDTFSKSVYWEGTNQKQETKKQDTSVHFPFLHSS